MIPGIDRPRGAVSRKVLAALEKERRRRVIDFGSLKLGAQRAEELERGVISEAGMGEYDPLHAVYIYAQNKMSVIVEQIMELPMCGELADAYSEGQEEYMLRSADESADHVVFLLLGGVRLRCRQREGNAGHGSDRSLSRGGH